MTPTRSSRLCSLGAALLLGLAVQPASADQVAEIDGLIRQLAPIADQQESSGPAPEAAEIHGRMIYIVPAHSVDVEVYFAFDSAELTYRAREDLTALGHALASQTLRPYSYLIAGHTDAKGGASHNQWLSEHRAEAALRFLIETFPIDPDRLIAVGWGESRLKTPETPDAAINRRVEVTLIRPIGGYAPRHRLDPEASSSAAPDPDAAPGAAPDPTTPIPADLGPDDDKPLPGTLQKDKDGGLTITW